MGTPSESQTYNPEQVAGQFVSHYYTLLHKDPLSLHRLYKDDSCFTLVDHGETQRVAGISAIQKQVVKIDYSHSKVKIDVVDAQESLFGSHLVNVLGTITNKGSAPRAFVQTFLLASQSKGFYVRNDIFRYLDQHTSAVPASKPGTGHAVKPPAKATPAPVTPTPVVASSAPAPAATSTTTTTTTTSSSSAAVGRANGASTSTSTATPNTVPANTAQDLGAPGQPSKSSARQQQQTVKSEPRTSAATTTTTTTTTTPASNNNTAATTAATATTTTTTPTAAAAPAVAKPAAPKSWASIVGVPQAPPASVATATNNNNNNNNNTNNNNTNTNNNNRKGNRKDAPKKTKPMIFVTDIGQEDSETIMQVFADFKPVSINIKNGFAFVTFNRHEDVDSIMSAVAQNAPFGTQSQRFTIERANKNDAPSGNSAGNGGSGGNTGSQGGGRNFRRGGNRGRGGRGSGQNN